MDWLWVGSAVADGLAVYIVFFALLEAGLFALAVGGWGVGVYLSYLGVDDACNEGQKERGPHCLMMCLVSWRERRWMTGV